MLSIENYIAKTIDLESILINFANKKNRKVFFYKRPVNNQYVCDCFALC